MVDIDLIMRVIQKKGDDINFEDKVKGSIKIEKPKSYEELINKIQKGFNLSSNDLAVVAVDEDDDENNIKNEDDFEENKGNCKKYKVILDNENETSPVSGPVQGKDDINASNNIEFDLESNLLNDEKELKDLLDKTMKKLENDNPKIEVDESLFSELNEKQSGDQNELYNYFLSNLNEKISDKNEAQKKSFLEKITKQFLLVEEEINEKVEEFKSNTKTYCEDSNEVLKDLNEMKSNIPLVEDPSLILKPNLKSEQKSEPKPKPKPVENPEIKKEDKPEIKEDKPEIKEVKPEIKEEDKREIEVKKPEPIPPKIEPEKIEIISEKKEYEFNKEDVKDFISIDIKIKNISNKKIGLKDKKIFIKDNPNKESEVKNNLNINEEMDNNNEKEIKVEIPMTQPIQKSYEYELYIKSSIKEEIITDKPYCFKITIKENEKPDNPVNPVNAANQENAGDKPISKEVEDEIYDKLNEEFVVGNFLDEETVREKIQELRGDMEKLRSYVEDNI